MPQETKTADRRSPIGIFDSGVGGLTVLKALRERLPDEHFVYLGDTARLPYGTKSPGSVLRYAKQAAAHLEARDVKLLVIACNTASAVALTDLREALAPLPVIGVIEPGARAAGSARPAARHLVLATEATVLALEALVAGQAVPGVTYGPRHGLDRPDDRFEDVARPLAGVADDRHVAHCEGEQRDGGEEEDGQAGAGAGRTGDRHVSGRRTRTGRS